MRGNGDRPHWAFKKVEIGDKYLTFKRGLESRHTSSKMDELDKAILCGWRWVSLQPVFEIYEVDRDDGGFFVTSNGKGSSTGVKVRLVDCLNSPPSLGMLFAGVEFLSMTKPNRVTWYSQLNMFQSSNNGSMYYSDEGNCYSPSMPIRVRFRIR